MLELAKLRGRRLEVIRLRDDDNKKRQDYDEHVSNLKNQRWPINAGNGGIRDKAANQNFRTDYRRLGDSGIIMSRSGQRVRSSIFTI